MSIDNPESTAITPPTKIRGRWVHIYLPENGYIPGDAPASGEELPRIIVDLVGCEPEMDGESQAVNGASRLKWTDDVNWSGSISTDEATDPESFTANATALDDFVKAVDNLAAAADPHRVTLRRIEQ